eukprot:329107-Chlamydomonas_euryale.AAC.20
MARVQAVPSGDSQPARCGHAGKRADLLLGRNHCAEGCKVLECHDKIWFHLNHGWRALQPACLRA